VKYSSCKAAVINADRVIWKGHLWNVPVTVLLSTDDRSTQIFQSNGYVTVFAPPHSSATYVVAIAIAAAQSMPASGRFSESTPSGRYDLLLAWGAHLRNVPTSAASEL
jgi:hypothetical protein